MDDATMTTMLAAAWDAGFDACSNAIIAGTADAQRRGYKAALRDVKPVKNPYKEQTNG